MESLSKKVDFSDGVITRSNYVLRLQRTNYEIGQLSKELKSYTYEPCTYKLHQQFQSLKERMEILKKSNDEILSLVEGGRKLHEDISDSVKNQIRDYKEVRLGFSDYTKLVKSHY